MKNQRTKERNLSKRHKKPKDEEEHVESIFEYEPKHASSTDVRC